MTDSHQFYIVSAYIRRKQAKDWADRPVYITLESNPEQRSESHMFRSVCEILLIPSSLRRLIRSPFDDVCSLLSNGIYSRLQMCCRDYGHDGSIDYTQLLHAIDKQVRGDDTAQFPRHHLAAATGISEGGIKYARRQGSEDIRVSLVLRTRQHFHGPVLRDCACIVDPASIPHRFDDDLDVGWVDHYLKIHERLTEWVEWVEGNRPATGRLLECRRSGASSLEG